MIRSKRFPFQRKKPNQAADLIHKGNRTKCLSQIQHKQVEVGNLRWWCDDDSTISRYARMFCMTSFSLGNKELQPTALQDCSKNNSTRLLRDIRIDHCFVGSI